MSESVKVYNKETCKAGNWNQSGFFYISGTFCACYEKLSFFFKILIYKRVCKFLNEIKVAADKA